MISSLYENGDLPQDSQLQEQYNKGPGEQGQCTEMSPKLVPQEVCLLIVETDSASIVHIQSSTPQS